MGAAGARRDPLPALTLAFTAGVLAVLQFARLVPAGWLAIASIPALLPWRFRGLYAAFVLGALLCTLEAQRTLEQRWPANRFNEEVAVQGAIASLPDAQQLPSSESDPGTAADSPQFNWRFEFVPNAGQDVPPHLRVAWYRSETAVKGGECWRFTLRLRAPHGSADPGASDYEEWLFRQGIGATATVRDAAPCGEAPGFALLRLRQRLSDRLRAWLPSHPAEPLIAALTFGDDTGLTSADWDRFRLTGTTHLVAISGFNIAIVAGLAFFLLRWSWSLVPRLCLLWPAQRAGLLGSALLAFGYSLLAGFDPPVARAAFMLLAFVAAAALGGAATPLRALLLAWLAILATHPLAVLTPGLWLSFGAVAAIFHLTAHRLAEPAAWIQGIRLQLMLSLVLAPLTLFYFQGASGIGPLVNLVAVPIVAIATPVLLALLLLAWALPVPGVTLLRWSADALDVLHRGLDAVADATPQTWLPLSAQPAALLLALVGALLLFAPRGVPLRAFALLCFLPLAVPTPRAPAAGFDLTALDVGQGLAVVVRTSHHTLLFDTGPAFEDGFDAGRSVVAPYLLHEGLRALDVMMISHADLDHRGGAPAIRRLIQVREERGALAGEPCREGQTWQWDGVRFDVLNGVSAAADAPIAEGPAPPRNAHQSNDSGCVLKVTAGDYAALLPADIEAPVEARLVAARADDLAAAVVLAPHHGSRTSSSEAFVEAVNPELVIFPAGYRNAFNHPRGEVVARWLGSGAELHMTGTEGAVRLHVDPQRGIEDLRGWRAASPHLWSAPPEPVPRSNGPVHR